MADTKKVIELIIKAKDELGPGLASAVGNMEKLREASLKIGAGLLALGSAGVAGMAAIVKSTTDAEAAMYDLSQRTGLSTIRLSEFKELADQNGSSVEGVATAIKFLSKAMVGVSEDGTDTSGVFKQLGVDARDSSGNLRNAGDVFVDVLDSLSKKNDVEQTAFALKLFGRGAIDLKEILKLGRDGIQQYIDSAHTLGHIVKDEDAKAADDLKDSMHSLHESLAGVTRVLANELIPKLTEFVKQVEPVITRTIDWAKAHPGLAEGILKTSLALAGAGGLLVAVASISTTMATATPIIAAFWAAATGPVGLVALAVGALAFLGVKVAEFAEKVKARTFASTGPSVYSQTNLDLANRTYAGRTPLIDKPPPPAARSTADTDKLEFWELTPAEQAVRYARDVAAVAKWTDQMLKISGANGITRFDLHGQGEVTSQGKGAPTPEQLPAEQFSKAALYVAQLRQDIPALGKVGIDAMVQLGDVVGSSLVHGFKNLGAAIKQWGEQAVASIAAVIAKTLILKALTALIPGVGSALKFLGLSAGSEGPIHAAGGVRIAGGVPGRDSVPVLMQSGESALSVSQTAKLDQLLRQGGGGGNSYHIHVGAFMGSRGDALEFVRQFAALQREQLSGSGL